MRNKMNNASYEALKKLVKSEDKNNRDSGYYKYKVLDIQRWEAGFEDEWLQKCRIY